MSGDCADMPHRLCPISGANPEIMSSISPPSARQLPTLALNFVNAARSSSHSHLEKRLPPDYRSRTTARFGGASDRGRELPRPGGQAKKATANIFERGCLRKVNIKDYIREKNPW